MRASRGSIGATPPPAGWRGGSARRPGAIPRPATPRIRRGSDPLVNARPRAPRRTRYGGRDTPRTGRGARTPSAPPARRGAGGAGREVADRRPVARTVLRTRPDGALRGIAEAGGSVVGPVTADGTLHPVWRPPGEASTSPWTGRWSASSPLPARVRPTSASAVRTRRRSTSRRRGRGWASTPSPPPRCPDGCWPCRLARGGWRAWPSRHPGGSGSSPWRWVERANGARTSASPAVRPAARSPPPPSSAHPDRASRRPCRERRAKRG